MINQQKHNIKLSGNQSVIISFKHMKALLLFFLLISRSSLFYKSITDQPIHSSIFDNRIECEASNNLSTLRKFLFYINIKDHLASKIVIVFN